MGGYTFGILYTCPHCGFQAATPDGCPTGTRSDSAHTGSAVQVVCGSKRQKGAVSSDPEAGRSGAATHNGQIFAHPAGSTKSSRQKTVLLGRSRPAQRRADTQRGICPGTAYAARRNPPIGTASAPYNEPSRVMIPNNRQHRTRQLHALCGAVRIYGMEKT